MGKKIVTFGELLLRFSKPGQLRLTQGDLFTSKYGGSEANVAVSLATQGEEVTYITRLPDTPVGRAGAMNLAQLGVKILKDCAYFHVSGITAAISPQAAEATFEALDIADELGVTICFDINYRKNLWQYEGAEPRKTLSRMLSRCDMMFGDAIEFDWLSQHPQPPFTATDSNFEMQMKEYGEWFDELHAQYPRLKHWMMGMRNIVSSNHHTLTALLWTEGKLLQAPIIDIPDVIDPVGVGDAFMGGWLHAVNVFPDDRQKQLNYSLAAAALKNTVPGDFNLSTEEEIMDVMEGRHTISTLYKTFE